jgi:hypothetical protein
MTREQRLFLLLARAHLDEAERNEARALAAGSVDWARTLRLAQAQEVVPLVHANLQRLGFLDAPPEVREALEAGRRAVAARNALLAREQVHVLRVLSAAGLAAIPMKGVSLAQALYGDPGLRDCSDIDVLVGRDRAREALRILRGLGYESEFSERFFEALLLRGHIEYTLRRRAHGFEYVLDLHWGIGWSARADRRAAAALWAESRRVTRDDVEMHVMTPEWELLALIVHAARHGWQPIKWLVDVHDYCASRPVDWQTLCGLADRFDWRPAVEQTFGACRVLLGTPTPPGVRRVAPAGWVPVLDGGSATVAPDALLPLRVIRRSSEKARYLLKQVLAPTLAERRLVRLPSSLGLLYYPMRPVRLGGKWGWRLLRTGARRFRPHRVSS